jgi:hypothetical protein
MYMENKIMDVVAIIEENNFDFNAVCRATGLAVDEIRLIAALYCNYSDQELA